ncbi:MAG TPA: glycosyltransferase, partial [Oligoflexia bacterium]|nr:glycosyltransferase [Oligoflexia bacterium]
GPSLRKALFDLLLFMQTLFLAATRRYSAIHGIEDAGIIAALIGRIFSIPVVYEKHSDLDSYRGGLLRNAILRVYSVVERWTISLANAIIATGPGLAQQVKQSAPGANVHHIFDIPSSVKGADAERTSAVRGHLKKSPDEILVTYVGSFAVYQGIDLLFASIPKVLQTHTQARYIIIGGSKHEIAQRKNDLAQFGLAERVSFIGKIPPDD